MSLTSTAHRAPNKLARATRLAVVAALLGLLSLVPGAGAQSTTYDFSAFIHESSKDYSTRHMGYTNSDGDWKYWSSWFASDGTTMWVSGYLNATAGNRSLLAHTLATGVRDSGKDITLASGNDRPWALATDGTHMWVLDAEDDRVYAYALSDSTRQDGNNGTTNREFNLVTEHQNRRYKWNDMWTDGTTVYLLYSNGHTDSHVYAYKTSNGNRDYGKDISFAGIDGGLDQPWGIWSDETTMWIADIHDAKLWAYTLSSRSRDSAKDLTLTSANDSPGNLYHDGTTLWVNDVFGLKMYAYEKTGGV